MNHADCKFPFDHEHPDHRGDPVEAAFIKVVNRGLKYGLHVVKVEPAPDSRQYIDRWCVELPNGLRVLWALTESKAHANAERLIAWMDGIFLSNEYDVVRRGPRV